MPDLIRHPDDHEKPGFLLPPERRLFGALSKTILGLLTFVWVCKASLKIIMPNYQASDEFPATFLACPKKGDTKEGHPAIILIRHARSTSVHFRNSGFALRQSEMFNPRMACIRACTHKHWPQARSHDGNVRMGRRSTALRAFTQIPHVSGAALHPANGSKSRTSWPAYLELLHAVAECAGFHAQGMGCPFRTFDLPLHRFQGIPDMGALHLCQS
jgi:hypothetical protein